MKTKLFSISCIVGILYFSFLCAGCGALDSCTQPRATVASSLPATMPPYSGPKARIAVQRFDVRAARANNAIGDGLRDMLATALIQSQRFSVVERQELHSILQEQELSASGAVESSSQVGRGKIKGAELIIVGSVTEFEPGAGGMKGGIGGGGWGAAVGAAIGGAMNKSHMAIDLRIVDTATSEAIAAAKIEGQARDVSLGGAVGGFFSGGGLGVGLGA